MGVARIPSHYVLVGHRVAHQGCVWLDCYAAPNQTACGPRPREAVGRSPALGPSKTGACLTLRGGASLALRGGAETLSLFALPVTMASKTLHGIHVMVVDPIGGRRFGPSGRCLVPEQGTPTFYHNVIPLMVDPIGGGALAHVGSAWSLNRGPPIKVLVAVAAADLGSGALIGRSCH